MRHPEKGGVEVPTVEGIVAGGDEAGGAVVEEAGAYEAEGVQTELEGAAAGETVVVGGWPLGTANTATTAAASPTATKAGAACAQRPARRFGEVCRGRAMTSSTVIGGAVSTQSRIRRSRSASVMGLPFQDCVELLQPPPYVSPDRGR
jgi:hypothetical protein